MSLGKPARLERVFQIYNPPLYFVTFCTACRKKILANEPVHHAFIEYARGGEHCDFAVGRYVIMPDHVHLFVRGGTDFRLCIWMRGLKRALGTALATSAAETAAATTTRTVFPEIWQRGFFDHLLRNSDSYSEKWSYVEQNPVRAGLVERADDWPYAGEIVPIDRV
ncbi:MAG: REP-associated tyrosine transposase [Chthoniobacterales bacterium]